MQPLTNWCRHSTWPSSFQLHQILIKHFDLILQLFELCVCIVVVVILLL